MAELVEGQKAPAFELPRDGGGVLRLADLAGKPVVPFLSAGRHRNLHRRSHRLFRAQGRIRKTRGDHHRGLPGQRQKHDKFKKKYSLALDLAADEELKTLNAYGVWLEKTLFGRKYMGVVRTTFLIGRDGRIARIWNKVRVAGHASEVLEAAKAL